MSFRPSENAWSSNKSARSAVVFLGRPDAARMVRLDVGGVNVGVGVGAAISSVAFVRLDYSARGLGLAVGCRPEVMLMDADITPTSLGKLSEGFKKFGTTVENISDISIITGKHEM